MPSTSHAKCRRCGGVRHKNLPSPYCGTCWTEYELPRKREHFRDVKRRRAEKAARRNASRHPGVMGGVGEQPGGIFGAIPDQLIEDALVRLAPDPIQAAIDPEAARQALAADIREGIRNGDINPSARVTILQAKPDEEGTMAGSTIEPTAAGRGRHSMQRTSKIVLTPEVRQEIADAYRLGMSTTEIAETWEVGQATLYAIVRAAGVPLRGRNGVRTPGAPPVPDPVEEPSTVPVSREEPMPAPTPAPAPVKVVPQDGTARLHYTVEYTVMRTETLIVAANNVGEAFVAAGKLLAQSEGKSGVEITSVTRTEGGQ